jgi:hypothetical protein
MSTSDAPDAAGRYVAEYTDGPLEGTTEHRFLQDGAPEPRITQYALVDGTDARFEYVAGEHREINGETFVHYTFDRGDSDPLQGQADPNAESIEL